MSGESILITLATTPGGPTSFPVVLRKVMELPPPHILDGDDGTFLRTKSDEWATSRKAAWSSVYPVKSCFPGCRLRLQDK